MPGLSVSNEFISRDEGLHCEFACFLLNVKSSSDAPGIGNFVLCCPHPS